MNISQNQLGLAIECTGRAGSVAIGTGPRPDFQIEFSAYMKHSAELFPAIIELLKKLDKKQSDIKNIYVSVGPGSFTGIRIAVTAAKIIAYANKCKVVQCSSLDVIANNFIQSDSNGSQNINKIGAIIDAKRHQFFTAVYEKQNGNWTKTTNDCLMKSDEFVKKYADTESPVCVMGEGLLYYKNNFVCPGVVAADEKFWAAKAENVYQLGWIKAQKKDFTDFMDIQPVYLRKSEPEEKQAP